MFERSLRIGRIAGVELRVHWSILLAFLFYYWTVRPEDGTSLVLLVALVALLFGSVTLHELGHALAARRFGIGTRQIVLWPLGGLALLERPPFRPRDELIISAAGPLVNLLIAGLLALTGLALTSADPVWYLRLAVWFEGASWPFYLVDIGAAVVRMNLLLAGFNLLPIYPLDGGRMMRAAITMGLGHDRANRAMVVLGLPLAVGLLLYYIGRGSWLGAMIAILLILVVAQLDPRLKQWIGLAHGALFNRAGYHFLRGQYALAVAAYSAQLARQPNNLNAYHNRGAAYHQLRQYDAALADYERVIVGDPARVKIYLDRAEVHADRKAYDLALADLDRAVELRPDDAEIFTRRGLIRLRASDIEQALAELDRAEANDPRLAWTHSARGVVLLNQQDLDGAETALAKALALNPRDAVVLSNVALAHHYRNDRAAAEAALDRSLSIDPTFANALALRGIWRMLAGDLEGAAEPLDRAAELSPCAVYIAWHRARLRHLRGDKAGANAEIERGLAIDTEEACVHGPSWLAVYVAGDLPWALRYYEHVLARTPELAAGYHGRADALRVNGRPAEALADYDRALALEPGRAGAYLGRALARAELSESPELDAQLALEHGLTPDQRRAAQSLLASCAAEPAAQP